MKIFIMICMIAISLFTLYYYADKENKELIFTAKNKLFVLYAILIVLAAFSVAALTSFSTLKLF